MPLFDTDISIHAPTRGATPVGAGRNQATGISIHAPTRGATASCQFGDPDRAISIHAPTRGATGTRSTKTVYLFNFNPRSHEGSDATAAGTTIPSTVFQSTLPRGERRIRNRIRNPVKSISIHAPTRGATLLNSYGCFSFCIFQSTLPRRERHRTMPYPQNPYIFQSTLPRGERLWWRRSERRGFQFQSTLPRGERQHINLKCRIYMYFNPRSHEGSDPFLPGVLGR